MGILNLGRVRGTMWYSGDGISGRDTNPAVYPNSGVTHAFEEDLFLNLSNGNDTGNVYACVTPGGPTEAEWAQSCMFFLYI